MSEVVVKQGSNPGCVIQLLWFVFIGFWAAQIWIAVAWFLMALIITLPLGIAMINNISRVIALREPTRAVRVRVSETGQARVESARQVFFPIRAVYFLLIGWWLSGLWMELAYLLCLTIIGMPIGFWMFDRVPGVLSLRR